MNLIYEICHFILYIYIYIVRCCKTGRAVKPDIYFFLLYMLINMGSFHQISMNQTFSVNIRSNTLVIAYTAQHFHSDASERDHIKRRIILTVQMIEKHLFQASDYGNAV